MEHSRVPGWARPLFGWYVVVFLCLGGCAHASAPPAPPPTIPLPTAPPPTASSLPTPLPPTAPLASPVPTLAPSVTPTVAAIPSLTPTSGLVTGFLMPTTTPALPDAVITADNLDKLRMLRTIGSGGLVDASVAPAGRLLAVATTAGLALFELPQMALIRFTPRTIAHVVVGPHGQLLVADHDLIRIADGVRLTVLAGEHPRFSPDGHMIATSTNDTTIIWRSSTGARLLDLPPGPIAFRRDGQQLAIITGDILQLRGLPGGELIQTCTLSLPADDPVQDLAFSADGQQLQIALTKTILTWQVADGQVSRAQSINPIPNTDPFPLASIVVLSPAGDTVARLLRKAQEWQPEMFELRRTLDGATIYDTSHDQLDIGERTKFRFSADGSAAVVWHDNPAILYVYDTLRVLDARLGSVTSLRLPSFIGITFSPDAQTLATVASSHIDLWHVVDGNLQQTFDNSAFRTGSIDYALDGQTLVINGIYKGYTAADSRAIGWDLRTGSQAFSWGAATGRIWAAHPSGVRLQQREFSWEIDLIIATTNISIPLSLPSHVSAAAFSPDGTLLAVGDEAGAVRLLQVSDQQLTGTLQVGAKVTSLTFSPDGSLLAVQREDGLVQIWHLGDAASLTTLAGAGDDRLVITADNQLIITGGQGGVTFYRLHDGQLLYHLDGAVDDLAIGPRSRLLALLRGGQVQMWGVGP